MNAPRRGKAAVNARRSLAGFTMVEVLIVVAVVAVIAALGSGPYLRWVAQNDAMTASALVQGEIARVRTAVKRTDAPVTLTLTSGGNVMQSGRTVALPSVVAQGTLSLTFMPPYGTLAENTALPQQVRLVSVRSGDVSRLLTVTSLFGHVVTQ